jgi:hypothetical protein
MFYGVQIHSETRFSFRTPSYPSDSTNSFQTTQAPPEGGTNQRYEASNSNYTSTEEYLNLITPMELPAYPPTNLPTQPPSNFADPSYTSVTTTDQSTYGPILINKIACLMKYPAKLAFLYHMRKTAGSSVRYLLRSTYFKTRLKVIELEGITLNDTGKSI